MSNDQETVYMNQNFSVSKTEQEALALIIKLTRCLDAVERKTLCHLGDVDLTVSQFGVLEALYHLGSMCQRDVARKVLKSTGNITTVIDNLEKRGLVERQTQHRGPALHSAPYHRKRQRTDPGLLPGTYGTAGSMLFSFDGRRAGGACTNHEKKLGLGQT